MELLDQYMGEIVVGTSSGVGGLVIALLKKFGNRISDLEKEVQNIRRELDINTALDRERHGKG